MRRVEIYTLPLHFEKVLYEGIVTDEFSLDEINDALDLMRSGKSGRILINVS